MKILSEGDRGYALSPERGRVEVEYRYRAVKLEETGVTVRGVLVGVDIETDEVLTIPAQSVPKLKDARDARKERVMSVRLPNELHDVVHLVAEHYHRAPEAFAPPMIRYYLAAATTDDGLARRLGRLSKSPLAIGRRTRSLRLRVRPDLHDRVGAIALGTKGVNRSDLVRGAILAAKEDVLEGRAPRRREKLEAVAQAV